MNAPPWTAKNLERVLDTVTALLGLTMGSDGVAACAELEWRMELPMHWGSAGCVLRLQADSKLAASLAEAIVGTHGEPVSREMMQSAVAEMLNLVGGRLAGLSTEAHTALQLGTPTTIHLTVREGPLWHTQRSGPSGQLWLELGGA